MSDVGTIFSVERFNDFCKKLSIAQAVTWLFNSLIRGILPRQQNASQLSIVTKNIIMH